MSNASELDKSQKRLMIQMGLRSLILLALVFFVFVVLNKLDLKDWLVNWLSPLTSRPWLLYTIFILFESYLGIFPPEVFMMFALDLGFYGFFREVLFLAILSNLGGLLGFSTGKYLGDTELVKRMTARPGAKKYVNMFDQYGGLVILLAAVTPLPFALISILGGTLNLSYKKYIINAIPRILRFLVYGYFVWEASVV